MKYFLQIVFVLCIKLSLGQDLVINEFSASNSFQISDNFSQFDDWVEIYNYGTEDINIAGMWITDNLADPFKWQVPDNAPLFTTVSAQGYLLLWFDNDTIQGPLHTNSKLQRSGEQIGIYDEVLNVIDTLTYTEQYKDVSYGRFPDGSEDWFFFDQPSPEYSNNSSTPFDGIVKGEVAFSNQRGFYSGSQILVLSQSFTSGEIRYTVDGTKPNTSSTLFEDAIVIDSTKTIRAAVFQDNLIPSEVKTHTFFIDYEQNERKVPVLSITGDYNDFWSSETGLFTQDIFVEWEYEVNLEYFDKEGISRESMPIGVDPSIYHNWDIGQKPLRFIGRDKYGEKYLNHRLFEDINLNKYRSFHLSHTNSDWGSSMIRGLLSQNLFEGHSRMERENKEAVSVHFDTEYLGMYILDCNMDADYFADLYNWDNDSIDIITGNGAAVEGSPEQYLNLLSFINSTSFDSEDNYNALLDQIDVGSYMDYIIALIYLGNDNWASENVHIWKSQTGGKWKWILKNMDASFDNPNDQLFDFFTDEFGGIENPEWATLLLRKLLENDSFRNEFISRLADYLYLPLHPLKGTEQLNLLSSYLENEMTYQIDRWFDSQDNDIVPIASIEVWNESIDQIESYIAQKAQVIHTDAINTFDELNSISELTLEVIDEGDGKIFINDFSATDNIWTGDYFSDIEFTLTAVPDEGFRFVEWLGVVLDDTSDPIAITSIIENTLIQALFEPNPDYQIDIVINEIKYQNDTITNTGDWLELYNNTEEIIDLSHWKLYDGKRYFEFPNNTIISGDEYIVCAQYKNQFLDYYENAEQTFGDLSFSLSKSGEELLLIDASNMQRDSVKYFSENPWPIVDTTSRSSIELIAPYLLNEYGHNWKNSLDTLNTAFEINSEGTLHFGKLLNQEINIGEVFANVSLEPLLYHPGDAISDLSWSISGNENISIEIDEENLTMMLSYEDWQGVEMIQLTVTNDSGQMSSDSALFFVGSIVTENLQCNETYTSEFSPYYFPNSIEVPSSCYLHVEPGVEMRFAINAELVNYGELIVSGNENDKIILQGHSGNWNGVLIDNATASFDYFSIRDATYGTDSVKHNAAISGYFSDIDIRHGTFENNLRSVYAYYGNVLIDSTHFKSSNFGEKVNLQFANGETSHSVFEYTYGDNDALDYDATDVGSVHDNIFYGGDDDGVDIGQFQGVSCQNIEIYNNDIRNFADKNISVGEGSQNIEISRNVLVNGFYGIGVKDFSSATIDHCSIVSNKYGIACFEKNTGLGGGIANVSNCIVSHSTSSSIFLDETSELELSYTNTDDQLYSGIANTSNPPYYTSFDTGDFSLSIYSPCIDQANPGFELDPDGTRSDMGALYKNRNIVSNPVTEQILLFPNPASTYVNIGISNHKGDAVKFGIYDFKGKEVYFNDLEESFFDMFNNSYIQLDVSSLINGYYMIRMEYQEEIVSSKLLIIK